MKTAILHYSALPVVGGVEAVIQAHAQQFSSHGLPLTIIAGRGEPGAMPDGVDFIRIDEMDTMHPEIATATQEFNAGRVPETFQPLVDRLIEKFTPVLSAFDHVIIHNVLTKHFNLPLTAALFHLMDRGVIQHPIAWCHDLSWSSPSSRNKVFPAYPWELLKTYRSDITYVAISKQRQNEIVCTFKVPPDQIKVIYNGVEPITLLDLSAEGTSLINRLGLWSSDLILLMPVRVTQAKNIEYAIRLMAALKKKKGCPKLILTGPPDPHDSASMQYYQSLLTLRRNLDVENEMRFVFESGVNPEQEYLIDQRLVAELYRVCDAVFIPSHREGFGMPVLEAGLLGLPVIAAAMPAVDELTADRVLIISLDTDSEQLAEQVLNWLEAKPEFHTRVMVRNGFTWNAIFARDILPMLQKRPS
jgi:glycosyltransferase involved in cell wall biosynthesis